MIVHLVCEVGSNWPNRFVRSVFTSKKYVAIVQGNLCMATWLPPHGKKLPLLYGRLIRFDIPRVMHQEDISNVKVSGGRGRGVRKVKH